MNKDSFDAYIYSKAFIQLVETSQRAAESIKLLSEHLHNLSDKKDDRLYYLGVVKKSTQEIVLVLHYPSISKLRHGVTKTITKLQEKLHPWTMENRPDNLLNISFGNDEYEITIPEITIYEWFNT